MRVPLDKSEGAVKDKNILAAPRRHFFGADGVGVH
jgi:hypothetical protein